MNKTAVKAISLLLCVSVILTNNYSYASTLFKTRSHSQRFLEDEWSKKERAFECLRLTVPVQLGDVIQHHKGSKQGLIIHIQDRHADATAQFNIAGMITAITDNYGIDLLCLEGASDKLDTSFYDNIPDTEAKELTTKFYVQEGLFTGAEYYKISNKDKTITAYGVEDKDLYFEHVAAYENHSAYKESMASYLEALKRGLYALRGYILSEPLKIIDDKEQAYENKHLELKEFVIYITGEAVKNNIRLSAYPNLETFSRVVSIEDTIDFNETEKQRDDLVKILSNTLKDEALSTLLKNSMDFKLNKISASAYYEYIENIVSLNNDSINKVSYKQLFAYVDYIKLSDNVDNIILFDEIKNAISDIKALYYENDTQKLFDSYAKYIEFSIGLYELKLTEKNLDKLKAFTETINVSQIASFINEQNNQTGISLNIAEPPTNNKAFKNALDYYEIALKRDIALVDNTLRRMAVEVKDSAILITGGFHTRGIVNILKQLDISYIVVCPKVGTGDYEEIYQNRMNNRLPHPDAILNFISSMLVPALTTGNLADPVHVSRAQDEFLADKQFVEEWLNAKALMNDKENGGGLASKRIQEKADSWKASSSGIKQDPEWSNHINKLDPRPIENGLLKDAYVSLAMEVKKIVNNKDEDKVAIYGGAGADFSFLLSTNVNKAYFIEQTPINKTLLISLLEKWVELEEVGVNVLEIDRVAKKYLENKYKRGYAASTEDFMLDIEIKILTELKAMGVNLNDIEIALDNDKETLHIKFDWDYLGKSKKTYEIIYIQADIVKPDKYLNRISEDKIDIYYQKAGRSIPVSYKEFLEQITQKLKNGGYLITDDHYISSSTTFFLPDRVKQITSDPITSKGLEASRKTIKDISRGYGYGWNVQIRQKKEVMPYAVDVIEKQAQVEASKAQEKTSSSGIKNKINEIISTFQKKKKDTALEKTEVVFLGKNTYMEIGPLSSSQNISTEGLASCMAVAIKGKVGEAALSQDVFGILHLYPDNAASDIANLRRVLSEQDIQVEYIGFIPTIENKEGAQFHRNTLNIIDLLNSVGFDFSNDMESDGLLKGFYNLRHSEIVKQVSVNKKGMSLKIPGENEKLIRWDNFSFRGTNDLNMQIKKASDYIQMQLEGEKTGSGGTAQPDSLELKKVEKVLNDLIDNVRQKYADGKYPITIKSGPVLNNEEISYDRLDVFDNKAIKLLEKLELSIPGHKPGQDLCDIISILLGNSYDSIASFYDPGVIAGEPSLNYPGKITVAFSIEARKTGKNLVVTIIDNGLGEYTANTIRKQEVIDKNEYFYSGGAGYGVEIVKKAIAPDGRLSLVRTDKEHTAKRDLLSLKPADKKSFLNLKHDNVIKSLSTEGKITEAILSIPLRYLEAKKTFWNKTEKTSSDSTEQSDSPKSEKIEDVTNLSALAAKIINPIITKTYKYVTELMKIILKIPAGRPSAYIIERGNLLGDTAQVIPRELLEFFTELYDKNEAKTYLILDISKKRLAALLDAYGLEPCECIKSSEEILGGEFTDTADDRAGRIKALLGYGEAFIGSGIRAKLGIGSSATNIGIVANPIAPGTEAEEEFNTLYPESMLKKSGARVTKMVLDDPGQTVISLPQALHALVKAVAANRDIGPIIILPPIVAPDAILEAIIQYKEVLKLILKSA